MARPLQVLSLLSRFGALSVMPQVSVNGCRFASRGASKAWMGQSHVHRDRASRYSDEMSDGESELDDVEDKLQAVFDEERKVQRTVKYHILKRKMTPRGAAQRKLTWDAIEQIRYLKREQPEEWTTARLAEGFSVTPDVILRVLKSTFVPSLEKRAKQDARVMSGLGQQVLASGDGAGPDRLKLPGNHKPAALPPGRSEGAAVLVADKTLMLRDEVSGSLAKSPAPVSPLPTPSRAISQDVPETQSQEEDDTFNVDPTEEEEEERWDGRLLTEEELEEFMEMAKPRPVVQVGNEVFDAEGDFLYRI